MSFSLAITAVAMFGIYMAGCACCGTACGLCSDSFAYTAGENTDVDGLSSCGWTEIVADWTIKTNHLKTSGTAFAIIRCDTTHTTEQLSASVQPSSPSGYGRWRIILDYNSTTDYAWAELKLEGAGSTLSVGQNIAGVDTTHTSTPVGGVAGGTLTACITDLGHIRAEWQGFRVDAAALPGFPFTTGTAALGSGNSTTEIWFNNFTLRKAEEGNDCPDCLPQCSATLCPDNDDLPATLTVVVSGVNPGTCPLCTSFNGTFILDHHGSQCLWTYTTPSFCGGTWTYSASIQSTPFVGMGRFIISGNFIGPDFSSRHDTTTRVPNDCDAPWPALPSHPPLSFVKCTGTVNVDI